MSTSEIIVISIVTSVCLSCLIMCLEFKVCDKKMRELKNELDKTISKLDRLEQFTFELYEHFKEHLGIYHL